MRSFVIAAAANGIFSEVAVRDAIEPSLSTDTSLSMTTAMTMATTTATITTPTLTPTTITTTTAAGTTTNNTSTSSAPTLHLFLDDNLGGRGLMAASIVTACKDKTVYVAHCTGVRVDDESDLWAAAMIPDSVCGSAGSVRNFAVMEELNSNEQQADPARTPSDSQTVTFTEGPSLLEVYSEGPTITRGQQATETSDETCTLQGTTEAVCRARYGVNVQGSSTSAVITQTIAGNNFHLVQVVVTAGAEKMASATAACALAPNPTEGGHQNAAGPSRNAAGAVAAALATAGLLAVFLL